MTLMDEISLATIGRRGRSKLLRHWVGKFNANEYIDTSIFNDTDIDVIDESISKLSDNISERISVLREAISNDTKKIREISHDRDIGIDFDEFPE